MTSVLVISSYDKNTHHMKWVLVKGQVGETYDKIKRSQVGTREGVGKTYDKFSCHKLSVQDVSHRTDNSFEILNSWGLNANQGQSR